MNAFTFPQLGERVNAAAVPVPVHTLRALLAAALAWEIDTEAAFPGTVMPRIKQATNAVLAMLSAADASAADMVAGRLRQDRTEAEQG